ncbi:hypothetical protein KY346_03550 [Candidatus Woesearchaeota archaeon]|nr:hypothetical protein [Candidatus Woesearchaeota archaeon]
MNEQELRKKLEKYNNDQLDELLDEIGIYNIEGYEDESRTEKIEMLLLEDAEDILKAIKKLKL